MGNFCCLCAACKLKSPRASQCSQAFVVNCSGSSHTTSASTVSKTDYINCVFLQSLDNEMYRDKVAVLCTKCNEELILCTSPVVFTGHTKKTVDSCGVSPSDEVKAVSADPDSPLPPLPLKSRHARALSWSCSSKVTVPAGHPSSLLPEYISLPSKSRHSRVLSCDAQDFVKLALVKGQQNREKRDSKDKHSSVKNQ